MNTARFSKDCLARHRRMLCFSPVDLAESLPRSTTRVVVVRERTQLVNTWNLMGTEDRRPEGAELEEGEAQAEHSDCED